MRAAADGVKADTWWCTTPEAIRMITGVRGPDTAAVVGDRLLADASLDAALEHLPSRGRVAVDRITLADQVRLLAARPELEIVDAGAFVLAGSTPRSAAEVALLRDVSDLAVFAQSRDGAVGGKLVVPRELGLRKILGRGEVLRALVA